MTAETQPSLWSSLEHQASDDRHRRQERQQEEEHQARERARHEQERLNAEDPAVRQQQERRRLQQGLPELRREITAMDDERRVAARVRRIRERFQAREQE